MSGNRDRTPVGSDGPVSPQPRRTHAGVDAYIDGLPPWQRALCHELRELILSADPGIEETVKRSTQP